MKIDYAKLDPTGNTTILVKTPVPRARHGAVAAALLEALGGEQVGYVESPVHPDAVARLQMMGGEFCGNATMSLGALLSREAAEASLLLEVSGSDAPVPCRVRKTDGGWTGTVQMPPPRAIHAVELDTDTGELTAPLIEMDGISHLILPVETGLGEPQLRRRLPEWNAAIGADALGALLWDESSSSIDPLVWVPASGTLVRERGCGSGSAAVGCWLAKRAGRDRCADIRQAGGTITVDVRMKDGAFASVTITGQIRLVEEGTIRM